MAEIFTQARGATMFRLTTLKIVPLAVAIAVASGCGVRKTTATVNPAYTRAPTCDDAIVIWLRSPANLIASCIAAEKGPPPHEFDMI